MAFLNSSVDPSDTEYVFMTVNQYTGKTLQSGLDITGNVEVSDPVDFCFYLVGTGTVTNINQFFPLFTSPI